MLRDDSYIDLLIQKNFVTKQHIAQCEHEAKAKEIGVVDLLIEKKILTQATLLKLKSEHLGYAIVDLSSISIPQYVIRSVAGHLTHTFRFVPFRKGSGVLHIAMDDPSDLDAIDSLMRIMPAEQLEVSVTSPEDLQKALDFYFSADKERGERGRAERYAYEGE